MQWLKSLFGNKPAGKTYVTRRVTVKDPLVVQNPTIGFLNLVGAAARPLVDEDMAALKPLFSLCLESDSEIPICDVLMIYATIEADGVLRNASNTLREVIHKSRAPIVVVATENGAQSYIKGGKRSGLSSVNLVMTLKRKGRIFPDFLRNLFGMMHHGVTMPMAWVKLAPQIPGVDHPNVPDTICAMEVTHVLFTTVADAAR